jgi:hypothetical protein
MKESGLSGGVVWTTATGHHLRVEGLMERHPGQKEWNQDYVRDLTLDGSKFTQRDTKTNDPVHVRWRSPQQHLHWPTREAPW